VIVYNTKTGIEAAYRNKPVVIAGEAWIRGKGIGWDASNPTDYLNILDSFKKQLVMAHDQRIRAKQYAYHFFFRRMIRFQIFSKRSTNDNLFPDTNLDIHHLLGTSDANFQEVILAILENRIPMSKIE
jgi:hypothetical protein